MFHLIGLSGVGRVLGRSDQKCLVVATNNRVIRSMLGYCKPEGEGCLSWHTRTLRETTTGCLELGHPLHRVDTWAVPQHVAQVVVQARGDFHPADGRLAESCAL